MKRYDKVTLGIASVGAIGAMLLASPDAHADGLTFIQGLNDNGIAVYDTGLALQTGAAICQALNTANGVTVAENLYLHSTYSDVPSRATAAVWVIVAVHELCPQHDHTGSSSQSAPAHDDFGPFIA